MKSGIDITKSLKNQQQDLLLQRLFTASNVPESLVDMVRNFQEECIAQGIENKLHFKESLIKRCEIQIGTIHLDLMTANEEKVRRMLEAKEQATKEAAKQDKSAAGQITWRFTGVNQFGSVTISIKERSWQVEFSRLQRRISSLITDEAVLKPQAHQALYTQMKEMLRPIDSSEPTQMLILQGAPGLGKSHCTEHYFYHEAHHRHQMVAWLSGESKEAFLRDWTALANQLRWIDSKKKDDTDTTLIRHWCGEQLGQWLFIVDDLQIEMDWLKQYLPQKGGHVLITTLQPSYNLPTEAKILGFYPLSADDSVLLLKAWLGKYWEAAGFAKEAQALSYFSEALGGSPALLTQIALVVRKKGLSFERVMTQFQAAETRNLLLADTIFDQLKGKTFLESVNKSWRQWIITLEKHYPQITYQQHEVHLVQFVNFLKQEVVQALEKAPEAYVDERVIIAYWQAVWASLSCSPLDKERIGDCLKLLPLTYDKENQRWVVSLAVLHALEWQSEVQDLAAVLPALAPQPKKKIDLPQIPSGVSVSMSLENNSLSYVEVALLSVGKLVESTTWRLPTVNPYYIPRPALTEEIAEKLPYKATHEQCAELVLAAASGMGGIGKTELARHFINEPLLSSQYKRRFWFNAENTSVLRNEFYDFATFLGLIEPTEHIEDKELIERLHRWFNLNAGWLMIFDNADNYNSIAQWVPKEGGCVLITTREPTPGTLTDEQIIKVPLLAEEEAVIWLYRLAQREHNTATEAEQNAAKALVENLGYLPLAIAQAGAYLREQKTVSIKEYLNNFFVLLLKDESLIEDGKPVDKKSNAYSRRVVASTWRLSLERIEVHFKEKNIFNACPWLLAACSYLAPKEIPMGLLECWFKEFFQLTEISSSLLSYLLDEYTGQLLRYSLCERLGQSKMISMHRLVQEVLRSCLINEPFLLEEKRALLAEMEYLPEEIEQKSLIEEVVFPSISIALADYSNEFSQSIDDRKRRIGLIPHLQTIISTWEILNYQDEISPKTLALLYNQLADIQIMFRINTKEGLIICQKRLELCQKHYGTEHQEVASALLLLGIAYGDVGDAGKQKNLLEMALTIVERDYGSEHPEVATILINLSNAYGVLGNTKQQKKLLEKALSIFEQHDSESPKIAIAYMNLGNAYAALGDVHQQKDFLEKALAITEHYYGSEHPEVAKMLTGLSAAYGLLGNARQQKHFAERALHIKEHHYGSDHPHLATTLMNLSGAYGLMGDARQREHFAERALCITQNYYGPEHPEVAKILVNLGNANGVLGDAMRHKSLLEKALPIFESYYGPEHPQVAIALGSLGNAYGALENVMEQKRLLERALGIFEQHYGSEHSLLASILMDLGRVCSDLGDAYQGKIFLEKAMRLGEQYYGSEHPEVAKILANLSAVYAVLNDVQQQKRLAERALHIRERYYGPEHIEVAKILILLSGAYYTLGDAQQQKNLLMKALPIFKQYYGPDHPELAMVFTNLGTAHGALGDAQQQKSLMEKAFNINEHYYGPEHPAVATAAMNLGVAYGVLGDAQQQKHLLERALGIFEQHYGPEHPRVATTLMHLSDVYNILGEVEQEKCLVEKALRIGERCYGSEHPEIAKMLTNLGSVYGALGNAQQQKHLLEKALSIFEHHYGLKHPQTAILLMNLSSAYGALGDVKQQKRLAKRALLIREQYYGPEHHAIVTALMNLSNVYGELGNIEQKKNLLERALYIDERHYGSEHPEVARTLNNLGNTYGTMRNAGQQKRLLERALHIKENYYGPSHPHLVTTLIGLSNACDTLGDVQQKKRLLERALLISEQHYGPASHKQMGDLLFYWRQPLEAISSYEKALNINPESLEIHYNLAFCYHIQGNIQKADACFQRGVSLFPTPGMLAEYAHFLVKNRRFQESFTFINQCLKAVTNDMLSYGLTEYPVILPIIQSLMDERSSPSLKLPAQGLAHYLQVLSYQMCQQKEQARKALQRFEWWIGQQLDPQQQAIFNFLKSSLNIPIESILKDLLSLEQQFLTAVIAGDLNIIRAMLEKKNFSIDCQENNYQRTALHLACLSQQQEVIAYLLSKMARFDIKDKEGKFAWEYVINTPFLTSFEATPGIFTRKYSAALNGGIFLEWGKVLRMAVANNYLADVRFLIEVKKININDVDANPNTRYTALHLAIIKNKPEIAKYLVSKGANINALDANKKTPLDYIKPEQTELLALFHIPVNDVLVDECRVSFKKLNL